jgi:uncharacterized protein YllA (UPF0747 family)
MRNKLKENANWFFTEVQQKAYVQIRIENDAMKHLIFRFFKNSIKSYIISKKIFDDLYQIFDDSNRRTNVMKAYRRLKLFITINHKARSRADHVTEYLNSWTLNEIFISRSFVPH